MNSTALLIIYNHKFEKNIKILERLYKNRFGSIFHLVPFYTGKEKNVIPVYENSIYFQGYIAQALGNFYHEKYSHYLFIADDLLLNPDINEHNFRDFFRIEQDKSFLPDIQLLHDRDINEYWSRIRLALEYSTSQEGLEIEHELPTYEQACKALDHYGIKIQPLKFRQVYVSPSFPVDLKSAKYLVRWLFNAFESIVRKDKLALKYPLVGANSDIFIVSRSTIRKFAHYCGVFAAGKLFAELAIPTSLMLAKADLITEKALERKGKALWTSSEMAFLDQYGNDLDILLQNFPSDLLYLHPVKLSAWKKSVPER